MKKIKTLLVDDEYLALNLLENFIQNLPDLEVVGKAKSGIQALEVLNNQPVDLLFLDIQMPTLSGNNLLKTLKHPPLTIFTTAYAEYAAEAFDLNAVDYLLKPFSFERFLQAVNKAKEQLQAKDKALPAQTAAAENKVGKEFYTAKVDGKIVKIYLRDILYIEGLKEYVRFQCGKKRYVVYESLKNLEAALPSQQFLRVHKSFIVAKEKVQTVQGHLLSIGEQKIPISRQKREAVVKEIFGEVSSVRQSNSPQSSV